MAEAVATGLAEQCAILPSICLVRSPSALRFIDEKVPGISVPAELIERCESAADPEAECFEVACELAEHARSLPGVARPAPDQLPPRGRHRTPVPPPRHPNPRRKGVEWIPSSSRGLRPSSSGRSSRSA